MAKKGKNKGAKRAVKAQKRKAKGKARPAPTKALQAEDFVTAQSQLQEAMTARAARDYAIKRGPVTVGVSGEGVVKSLQFEPELLSLPHEEMEAVIVDAINSSITSAQRQAELEVPAEYDPLLKDFLGQEL